MSYTLKEFDCAVELDIVIKAMDSHGLVSKINVKNSDK